MNFQIVTSLDRLLKQATALSCASNQKSSKLYVYQSIMRLVFNADIHTLNQTKLYQKWGWEVKGKHHFVTPWGEFGLWVHTKVPVA